MAVSDRFTDDEQSAFMESPDVRNARRQAQLGELAVVAGQKFRGKRRPSLFEGSEIPRPDPIPDVSVHQLNALLRASSRHNMPLKDEIIAYPKVSADWDSIERYITHAGSASTRIKQAKEAAQGALLPVDSRPMTAEQKRDERNKKQRKSQHIADKVQRDFRTGLTSAVIRRAVLGSIQESIREELPFNRSAAYFASDAIEDLGFCLEGEAAILGKMPSGASMPRLLRHLGEYSADDPEALRPYGDVLQLAQEEQVRRAEFWGTRLDTMLEHDRDRRTNDDLASEAHVERLIASFRVHEY